MLRHHEVYQAHSPYTLTMGRVKQWLSVLHVCCTCLFYMVWYHDSCFEGLEWANRTRCSKWGSAKIFIRSCFNIYNHFCIVYITKIKKHTVDWMANSFTTDHHRPITMLALMLCLPLNGWQEVRPSWLQANKKSTVRTRGVTIIVTKIVTPYT